MRFWSKLAALAAITLAGPVAAQLPAATVLGEVLIPKTAEKVETVQLGATIALTNPVLGSASFSSSGLPFPSLTADAQSGPDPAVAFMFTRGTGVLNYSMMLTSLGGPAGSVPVLALAAGAVSGTASAGATFVLGASWELIDLTSGLRLAGDAVQTTTPTTGSFSQSFGGTTPLQLQTDHLYRITLRVDAEAAASEPGSQVAAHAFVDPVFSLGAGVDPALYAFSFSAGIGNTAPVPETGTLALLLGGLLMLAVPVRRRLRLC